MDPRISEIRGPDLGPFETLTSNLIAENPSNEQLSQADSLFNLCQQTDPNTGKLVLNCVVNEQNKPINKILGHIISELAAYNGWPELMTFMFDLVASEDSMLQKSALHIFAQLAQYVGDSLGPHITDLHGVFMRCLGNGVSADVRIAALIAVIKIIQCLKSSSYRDRFQDLLPSMMHCLTEVLNDGNEATAQEALNFLIELVKTEPGFFRGHLVEVVGGMLQIAEAENLEEGKRHLAIEFVITLVEAREQEPGMMGNLPPLFISRLFAILMRMLLSDIEDDADAGELSNYNIWKECLHRLPKNTIVPVANDHLSEYLAAPGWKRHLAGLVALAQIAKGCPKVMIPNLYPVVTMVLNSFTYPNHPRVRWAAINAIGELFADFHSGWPDEFQSCLLDTLNSALVDVENPQVHETQNNFDQLLLDLFQTSHHHVRLTAIYVIVRLSTRLDPFSLLSYCIHVLPALAAAIYEDPDPRVRLLAIYATHQLSAHLDPDLPLLLGPYHDYVLPAVHGAICDFKYPQVQVVAAFLMIDISRDLDTSLYLRVTVGTLLELRHREDIALDQNRISAIRYILAAFEEKLPHDTWTSTFNRLRPEQQAEFRSILASETYGD